MTLLQRSEKAEGPDRELDAIVAKELLGWKLWRSKHGYWDVTGPDGERFTTCVDPYGPKFDPETGKKNPDYDKEPVLWVEDMGIPEFSSSLDASIALVERVLPGWDWHVARLDDNEFSAAVATWNNSEDSGAAHAKTPPLALLTALLKALQHKETQG